MRLIDRNAQVNHWRRQPAVEKVLLSLGLMTTALCSNAWSLQVLLLALLLALLIFGARIRFVDIARAASIPAGFILASTLAQCIILRTDQAWPFLTVDVTLFWKAAFVGLRSLTCIAALLLLALTTPLTDLLWLLRRIGLGAEISDIALMMVRLIWLTLDCVEHGRQSQANRLGYTTYRRTLHSLGLLLSSLLPRVLGRAQRLQAGLAARGYHGELRFIAVARRSNAARLGALSVFIFLVAVTGRLLP
jgi:cobalt/nickel transport system permease protein